MDLQNHLAFRRARAAALAALGIGAFAGTAAATPITFSIEDVFSSSTPHGPLSHGGI